MTTTPHGMGQTATIYALCQIFKAFPALSYKDILIHSNGRVEITADGGTGVTKEWAKALPNHHAHDGMAAVFYGLTETDVLEQDGITVTIRRPPAWLGGVS